MRLLEERHFKMLSKIIGFVCIFLNFQPCTAQVALSLGMISTDEFRLVGGTAPNEGYVQIKHAGDPPDGQWLTICTNVTAIDSTIAFGICSRIGHKIACDYGTGERPIANRGPVEEVVFGPCQLGPTGPWEQDCVITGTQAGNLECSQMSHNLWLRCASDVGDLELRLADPLSTYTGLVQARCRGGQNWLSVCSTGTWDLRDADVACRHLGFAFQVDTRKQIVSNSEQNPKGVLISDFGCTGDESDILECQLGLVRTSCTSIPRISCGKVTNEFGTEVGLCGNDNLCGTECAQRLDVNGFDRRACHCDDACVVFNDCCYDYYTNCNPQSRDPATSLNGLPIGWFGCVDVPGFETAFDGYFLINKCPDSWPEDYVRGLCEKSANVSDVFAEVPVYNNITFVQYKNIYCAVCHGEKYERVVPWDVQARYSGSSDGRKFLGNFGVVAPGFNTFTGAFVVTAPKLPNGDFRRCSVPVVDTCLEEYRGSKSEMGCQSYSAAVSYRPGAFSGPITNYRNPYCALCNNITFTIADSCSYDFCDAFCDTDPWGQCRERCARPGDGFLTIDVLFNFKSEASSPEGMVACQTGEVYDPFLGKCRVLTCVPGYEVQNGKCVRALPAPTMKPTGIVPPNATFAYNPNNTVSLNLVDCLKATLGQSMKSIIYWEGTIADGSSKTLLVNFLIKKKTVLDEIINGSSNTTWCNATQVTLYLKDASILPVDICLNYSVLGSKLFKGYPGLDNTTMFTLVRNLDYDLTEEVYLVSKIESVCLDFSLTCPSIVTLNASEYVLSQEENVSVVTYVLSGRNLPVNTYVLLEDGRAIVCADAVTSGPMEATVIDLVYRYLYLLLTILSLIALLATFIIYSILQSLRNLAGQCIMNLVVALFVANLLLLLNGFFIDMPTLCLTIAPITHLTWLAAFLWMTMLSVNVARTIFSKVIVKTAGSTTKPLLLFMLCAWGISFAIVCICLALHFCQCTRTGPIYTNAISCYIVNPKVNLYAFGIPVALALATSICLFVFSVAKLRSSRAATRMARNETRLQDAKAEFAIYVRLCVIMGLTWILGFLTQVIDGYAIRFIFVILNSLQGVMIFLSFCTTVRVRGQLSELVGRWRARRRRKTKKRAVLLDASGTQTDSRAAQSLDTDTTRL